MAEICFVSAPVGIKESPLDGTRIDFDDIYRRALVPAISAAGFEALRVDLLTTRGSLQKAIYEAVMDSAVMIADISLSRPNVFYELGLRHAFHRRGTIIIGSTTGPVPFDISVLRRIPYNLDAGRLSDDETNKLIELLKLELGRSREDVLADSPIFDLFNGYAVALPSQRAMPLPGWRDAAKRIRTELLNALHADTERLALLRKLDGAVIELASRDPGLATELVLAYRGESAWNDIVELIAEFPGEVKHRPLLRQQLAMALNRRAMQGDRERAIKILEELAAEQEDSETYGLLGRIFKDRFTESGEAKALDTAIDYYRRGYEANPADYYPGINLLTLLKVKGGESEAREIYERAHALQTTLERASAGRRADYWNVATQLELAAVTGNWDFANKLVLESRLRAPASWMVETTARNLGLLVRSTPDGSRSTLERLIRDLTEGVGGGR